MTVKTYSVVCRLCGTHTTVTISEGAAIALAHCDRDSCGHSWAVSNETGAKPHGQEVRG